MKIHFIVDMDEANSRFSPNFGIGYLSSYLKSRFRNIETSVSLLSDDILADISRTRPDIVGISSTSRYVSRLKTLSAQIKDRFDLPIVWGGVHISIAPHELPSTCDVGVTGEGEITFSELLANYSDGRFRNLEKIKGIVYREDGEIVINDPRPFIEPIDSLPPPDLDLLRVPWSKTHRAVMITSRGCPFKCRFCASSKFWDRTRLHTAARIIEEMKSIAERYRVREILIYDDFFTINRKRIAEIAERKSRDPKLRNIKIECLSRIDIFDDYLADRLKEIGVYRIAFGIESGCQRTLDYLKNGTFKLEQVEKAVGLARAKGFECVGSFIIGSPYETAEEIEETLSFIKKLKIASVQITIATPFPGTELWEDGKKIGKITGEEWSDDYYVMFANSPDTDLAESLRGKVLLTQIEPERFRELVQRASNLANATNLSIGNMARILVDNIKKDPLGIPGKVSRGVRYLFQYALPTGRNR